MVASLIWRYLLTQGCTMYVATPTQTNFIWKIGKKEHHKNITEPREQIRSLCIVMLRDIISMPSSDNVVATKGSDENSVGVFF